MEKKYTHSNKYFDSSRGFFSKGRARAGNIKKIGGELYIYVGYNGSIFEVVPFEPNGLFRKYKRIVGPDNETENEICPACRHVHNEIACQTYNDVKTSIDDIPRLFSGRKKILIEKEEETIS